MKFSYLLNEAIRLHSDKLPFKNKDGFYVMYKYHSGNDDVFIKHIHKLMMDILMKHINIFMDYKDDLIKNADIEKDLLYRDNTPEIMTIYYIYNIPRIGFCNKENENSYNECKDELYDGKELTYYKKQLTKLKLICLYLICSGYDNYFLRFNKGDYNELIAFRENDIEFFKEKSKFYYECAYEECNFENSIYEYNYNIVCSVGFLFKSLKNKYRKYRYCKYFTQKIYLKYLLSKAGITMVNPYK